MLPVAREMCFTYAFFDKAVLAGDTHCYAVD
jgi:hypothetical protein